MEPELQCFDAQTRKAAEFGELKGGFMVRCSLQMCRQYVPISFMHVYLTYSCQQIIRPQTFPPALPWIAVSVRSGGGHKWVGMDQLEGGETDDCDCEVRRGC
jgi:hypothetical protein